VKLLYLKAIALAAKKVGVSYTLLLSICITESNLTNSTNSYDSNKGSHGICQINAVHSDDVSSLYNPTVNALLAAKILKTNLDKYKDTWVAVSAYSTGNNRWFNSDYVNKVKLNYQRITSNNGLVCLKKNGIQD
jgi:soluble lytic murein transglycosylase-like protein